MKETIDSIISRLLQHKISREEALKQILLEVGKSRGIEVGDSIKTLTNGSWDIEVTEKADEKGYCKVRKPGSTWHTYFHTAEVSILEKGKYKEK